MRRLKISISGTCYCIVALGLSACSDDQFNCSSEEVKANVIDQVGDIIDRDPTSVFIWKGAVGSVEEIVTVQKTDNKKFCEAKVTLTASKRADGAVAMHSDVKSTRPKYVVTKTDDGQWLVQVTDAGYF